VEAATPEKASALLQVQHGKERLNVHIDEGQAADEDVNTQFDADGENTQDDASRGIGDSAAFDESGYSEVATTCCEIEMEKFMRRLIPTLNLQLCNEYGLLGLLPWFACKNGMKTGTFESLKDNILLGVPPFNCSWVAAVGETCKQLGPECNGQSVPNSHRRRSCSSATTEVTAPPPAASANQAGGMGDFSDAVLGDYSSNSCPAGSVRITSAAACEKAAPMVGYPYDAERNKKSDKLPGGCMLNTYSQKEVYFNENLAGTPNGQKYSKLVCAGEASMPLT
jgi:hypothetical protein